MENKVVDFDLAVSLAVFDKERRTEGCIENISSTTLVEEHEIANCCSGVKILLMPFNLECLRLGSV